MAENPCRTSQLDKVDLLEEALRIPSFGVRNCSFAATQSTSTLSMAPPAEDLYLKVLSLKACAVSQRHTPFFCQTPRL